MDNKLLPNCPITCDDIIAAEHIFGPDVGSLNAKTVHHPSERVEAQINNIPMVIMECYREVVLGADIMFVQNPISDDNIQDHLICHINKHQESIEQNYSSHIQTDQTDL